MKFVEIGDGYSVRMDSITAFEEAQGMTRIHTNGSTYVVNIPYKSFKVIAEAGSTVEQKITQIAKSQQQFVP